MFHLTFHKLQTCIWNVFDLFFHFPFYRWFFYQTAMIVHKPRSNGKMKREKTILLLIIHHQPISFHFSFLTFVSFPCSVVQLHSLQLSLYILSWSFPRCCWPRKPHTASCKTHYNIANTQSRKPTVEPNSSVVERKIVCSDKSVKCRKNRIERTYTSCSHLMKQFSTLNSVTVLRLIPLRWLLLINSLNWMNIFCVADRRCWQ